MKGALFASCGPEGGVTRFTYDDAGNLLTVQDPVNNTTTYSYDGVGRVTMETNELDDARSYYYDSLGRVAKVLDRNERAVQFDFDSLDRLTMLEYEHGGTGLFTPYEWSYDNIHRITQFVSDDGTSDYEYDKTSQLTDADHDYQTDESYSYDANGNRTMTGYQTGGNNQLHNDGTYSYEYDGEGNRTSRTNDTTDEVTEYEWDHRNRLTKVTEKDEYGGTTQVVEYTYDVFNRRIGKAVDTTSPFTMTDAVIERYVYDDVTGVASLDGGNVVLDFVDPDGDGSTPIALERRYLYGHAVDQILAQEDVTESTSSADRVLWPLVDHLGTVRDLAKNDGTLGEHYEYDSYGNIASGDTSVTRYLFTSREFDEDTGLQHNRARWYDPAVGRWVSEDPIGFLAGDANLDRYAENSPANYVDPSGLFGKSGNGVGTEPQIPAQLKPGDLWVIVYINRPKPGERSVVAVTDLVPNFGHASIRVVGVDPDGKMRAVTRGFWPTVMADSLDRTPQPGTVRTDEYAKRIKKGKFDVIFQYLLRKCDHPNNPTLDELKNYMDTYDDNNQYDLDDCSCAHFVVDVMKQTGHPPLKQGTNGKGDGMVRITRYGRTKAVLTPGALGEDLRDLGNNEQLQVIPPKRAAPPTQWSQEANDLFLENVFRDGVIGERPVRP